jgi:hypothetical protein
MKHTSIPYLGGGPIARSGLLDYNQPPDGFLNCRSGFPIAYARRGWKSFRSSGKNLDSFLLPT